MSLIVSEAFRLPAAVGVNVTATEQLSFGAIGAEEHVDRIRKSERSGSIDTAEIPRAPGPLFVIVRAWPLLLPTVVPPKVRLSRLNWIELPLAGGAPTPVSLSSIAGAFVARMARVVV